MAKRFTDTDKWKDDWYLSLSNDNRIVWQWLLDNCNHAGICKKSITLLNLMCNTQLKSNDIVSIFHDRVLETGGHWFIPKFLKFQYSTLQSKKPAIVSVVKELKKDNYYLMIPKSFGNDYLIIKDKDKDTDKVKAYLDTNVSKEDENKKETRLQNKTEEIKNIEIVIDNTEFSKECITNKQWIEILSMQTKVSEDATKLFISHFEDHLITMQEQKKNIKDYKSHFVHWFKKQDLSQFRKKIIGKTNQINN